LFELNCTQFNSN